MATLKVFVFVEGGNVQAVATPDGDDIEYTVIDYDTDGADPEDLTQIKQSDGTVEGAHVYGPYDGDTLEVEIIEKKGA